MSIKSEAVHVTEYRVECNVCGRELHGPYDHCGPGARYRLQADAEQAMTAEGWQRIVTYVGAREIIICNKCLCGIKAIS